MELRKGSEYRWNSWVSRCGFLSTIAVENRDHRRISHGEKYLPARNCYRLLPSVPDGQPAFFDVARTRAQKCGTGKISSPNEEGRSGPSPGRNDQNLASGRTRPHCGRG